MKGIIREHSPGHYAIFIEQSNPTTCKRRRKLHSFVGTKREAQIECAKLISRSNGETGLAIDKITVAIFMERWLDHMKSRVSSRTLERYAEIVRKNLDPLIGRKKLTRLLPRTISAAYARALTSGRYDSKGGLSPQTVHHMHRVLKQAMSQAVRWRLLLLNPVDGVNRPKVEQSVLETYDLQQTRVLIEALRGTRVFVPALLAVLLGLRRGEISALSWNSVDLDAGRLVIVRSAEQMNGSCRLKPVNRDQARTVILTPTIIKELRTHRAAQAQELTRSGLAVSNDGFVCAYPDGSIMQPTRITHEWIRLIRKTGLPSYRFHDLRRAHAMHMLASGAHPKFVSKRLGISEVSISLYGPAKIENEEDIAARVDEAFQVAILARDATQKVTTF